MNDDYRFHIYSLSQKEFLFPFVEKSRGKIVLHDPLSRDALLSKLSEMDFLVNFEYDPLVQSPSKLIDYGLTKRPILNCFRTLFSVILQLIGHNPF